MGFFDKFLNAIKLNDDFDDDDYLDDDLDDEEEDDFDDEYEKPKTRKRFFSKFGGDDVDSDDADDYDDEDDFDEDEEPVKPAKKSRRSSAPAKKADASSKTRRSTVSSASSSDYTTRRTASVSSAQSSSSSWQGRSTTQAARKKVTPIRRKNSGSGMEVSVIRPSSMEDTREIADTLMNNCTVILNLEGLDVDIAQRVIDFSCGVCYSLEGKLQKVASYIFILTPADVDISGDFQSILSGAFDLSSMQTTY